MKNYEKILFIIDNIILYDTINSITTKNELRYTKYVLYIRE